MADKTIRLAIPYSPGTLPDMLLTGDYTAAEIHDARKIWGYNMRFCHTERAQTATAAVVTQLDIALAKLHEPIKP